jgi:hypothetical protein
MKSFSKHKWSLIPGPEIITGSILSTELKDVAEYSIENIMKSISELPNCNIIKEAIPSIWEWKAKWEILNQFIIFGMSSFDEDNKIWGGSELEIKATSESLYLLWILLRIKYKRIWLHNEECRIYSPEIFKNEYYKE